MGNEKAIANKDKHAYELLSGERISTGWLNENDKKWLKQLKKDVEDDADYFILLRFIRGVGAYPLKGSHRLTPEVAQSALFRVAQDIVERAGIRQGFALPPNVELETMSDKDFLSAPEAAEIIGITRAGVHHALTNGRLRGWRVGAVWVLSRADVMRYREKRQTSSS